MRKELRNSLYNPLNVLHLKLRKTGTQPQQKHKIQTEKKPSQSQTSFNADTHSDELQLFGLTQQNRPLLRDIKQLKYHYFAVERQPLLSLPAKASQDSRTAFFSYLIENC